MLTERLSPGLVESSEDLRSEAKLSALSHRVNSGKRITPGLNRPLVSAVFAFGLKFRSNRLDSQFFIKVIS
jgi:hypothetical protein